MKGRLDHSLELELGERYSRHSEGVSVRMPSVGMGRRVVSPCFPILAVVMVFVMIVIVPYFGKSAFPHVETHTALCSNACRSVFIFNLIIFTASSGRFFVLSSITG